MGGVHSPCQVTSITQYACPLDLVLQDAKFYWYIMRPHGNAVIKMQSLLEGSVQFVICTKFSNSLTIRYTWTQT